MRNSKNNSSPSLSLLYHRVYLTRARLTLTKNQKAHFSAQCRIASRSLALALVLVVDCFSSAKRAIFIYVKLLPMLIQTYQVVSWSIWNILFGLRSGGATITPPHVYSKLPLRKRHLHALRGARASSGSPEQVQLSRRGHSSSACSRKLATRSSCHTCLHAPQATSEILSQVSLANQRSCACACKGARVTHIRPDWMQPNLVRACAQGARKTRASNKVAVWRVSAQLRTRTPIG